MSVLFLFALQAAQPRPVPALVADPCAEGALDALDSPYKLSSAQEALEIAQWGYTDLFPITPVFGAFLAQASGPSCVIEESEQGVQIRGECSDGKGSWSTGEVTLVKTANGAEIVARAFTLGVESLGSAWRYDVTLRHWNDGDRTYISSIGSVDTRGPNPSGLTGFSETPARAYSYETCFVQSGSEMRAVSRLHVPGKRGSVGTVLVESVGGDPQMGLNETTVIKGRTTFEAVSANVTDGKPCYTVTHEGKDAGLVCVGQ